MSNGRGWKNPAQKALIDRRIPRWNVIRGQAGIRAALSLE